MNIKRSLRFKLTIGFITIAVPLVILLLFNNFYASNTVREEVADSNKNLVVLYANQIQTALKREANFLYNLAYEDPNILALSSSKNDPVEYYLTKTRVLNSLTRYHRFDNSMDFQFIYSIDNRDLFTTTIKTKSMDEMEAIKSTLMGVLAGIPTDRTYFQQWRTVKYGDEYALMRLVDTGYGYYLGAWVRLNNLMVPLELIQLGQEGFAAFVSGQGDIMTGILKKSTALSHSFVIRPEEAYQVLKHQEEKYIVVSNPIEESDLVLSAFIPEQKLLQKLSKLRSLIFLIPLFATVLLFIYLMYLNDIILKPMNNLTRGMRKIKQGDWNVRLNDSKSKEFTIINETFNEMALQIHELKINVYEEQINAHKAELKHLQLQINPHFLLNSINIIFNLAQLKNYSIIQAMCLNLVKYFRFTTKTNQPVVTIADEMEHMESYINIQQLRFPGLITYSYQITSELEKASIPPLLIQPFIENAIKHGFDFMDEPFHIDIRIAPISNSDQFEIVISDNGNGFSKEILSVLQTGRYFTQQKEDHLGVWNVYHRLQLIFGHESKLQFDNQLDSGAVVRLVIPVRTVEKFT
ncbi:sensor histidine kinase [Paenibacillus baekrokdamisoli]|uniref:Sensor histidine kinase n=1 Tax=Paenibacillus baekrokdamisoli TaxID=1712516 RepID=A0A3G9IIH9_9BACL|nr:histidine kinase [Paenibacillus baekrokdamisoli]MBB3069238.1 two-component system sensor histidine kinase YesM [Paenibacillus baekrokdamisoli]BBH18790.1 sensor histidine kinase [Paenibacillus baekrokdamisoli]